MRAALLGAAATLVAALALPATAQDATRGAALAAERNCAACHGAGGISAIPHMPSLAGQQADYITLQMILFREGLRQVPAMAEPARGLSDRNIEDLAAHFASLPSTPHPERGTPNPTLITRGAELSATRNCQACHLPDYSGRANVPRINHQREDFLLHSMQEYRDNQRVGADTQMNGLLHGLTNPDLTAIAHYLAQRP